MTIRVKLTMAFIAVIFVANFVLSLFTVKHIGRVWLQEIQTGVRLDLNSARSAYNGHMAEIGRFLEAVALDQRIVSALLEEDASELDRLLKVAHRRGGMEMLTALTPDGRVCHQARHGGSCGPGYLQNPVVAMAIERMKSTSGTIVLTREQLEREGTGLADRARFELLPTPAARPTDDTVRDDGMVVAAAVPITDDEGKLIGVLYGADLLNRRYEVVDTIKNEVFQQQVYEGRDIGTVTIFQGDLRISTNVTREDGARAVGTRLSDVVYERVLVEGGVWADRAFVVNDWYITAYEPIRDPTGRIIGALYVGLLEAPFAQHEGRIVGGFLITVSLTTLISLALLLFVTKLVLQPIEHIIRMSRKVVDGDLTARVGIRLPGEMGVLCQAVDAMADAVAQREEQLKEATQRRIGRTEKLASIGRLSAGIAHEINNPLTGVLTFAHLLRKKENMTDDDRQDLDLIIKETTRVSEIVRGLLDFARERPSRKELVDLNHVVQQTTRLIRSQKQVEQIVIEEELEAGLPTIDGDENQLQQVLLNLALNACEAMPDGGTLTISTSAQERRVLLNVTDTGCGIKREHLDMIFEPFFSTKSVGKGTGLGLSVSYGIIEQHNGAMEVDSEEGKGTTLTIAFPVASGESR